MTKMISKYLSLKMIIIIAVILRIFTALYMFDFHTENYWEYGEIAKNIYHGRGYSLLYIENGKIEHKYKSEIAAYPSAYMPPMYVFRILPFIGIENVVLRNVLFLISNLILSAAIIIMLYRLTAIYFDEKTALASAFIYALVPEFLFATLVFAPVLEFHFLILYLIFHLVKVSKLQLLHIFIGVFLLVAMRSEMIALAFILILIFLKGKNKIKALTIAIAVFLFVIPWTVRNYYVFNEFIPATTNSGINLYRGHNPIGTAHWGVPGADKVITQNKNNRNIEIVLNRLNRDAAIDFIRNNPKETIINSFKKLFYLWLYNPNDPRSLHPLYIIPWMILLITSTFGLIKTFNSDKYKYIYTIIILQTIISILFFAIPRYQTMLKVVLLPFSAFTIYLFIDFIKIRFLTKNTS